MRSTVNRLLSISALLACGVAVPAQATQVTVAFRAEVTNVVDTFGVVAGRIHVGDIVEGEYTYDADAPDSDPTASGGRYKQPAPYSMGVIINSMTFQSVPAGGYDISTYDNNFPGKHDFLRVTSNNNLFELAVPGETVNSMGLEFQDDDGLALASDAAPTHGPVLEDWPLTRRFYLSSARAGVFPVVRFQVEGRVISAETLPPALGR